LRLVVGKLEARVLHHHTATPKTVRV
jgi:hypothetical protein